MKRQQHGVALIAALFVITVLAAFAMFAARNGVANQEIVDLRTMQDRAQAAALVGTEWAGISINSVAACNAANAGPPLVPPAPLSMFTVTVRCQQATNHVPEGLTFNIASTATMGAYGSPTFVSRTIRKRIPN